jgi:hypothetical protein
MPLLLRLALQSSDENSQVDLMMAQKWGLRITFPILGFFAIPTGLPGTDGWFNNYLGVTEIIRNSE